LQRSFLTLEGATEKRVVLIAGLGHKNEATQTGSLTMQKLKSVPQYGGIDEGTSGDHPSELGSWRKKGGKNWESGKASWR